MPVNPKLQQAREFQQANEIQRMEGVCREVVAAEPDNPDALHLLGVSLHAQGKLGEAVKHYQKAMRLSGGRAQIGNDLGTALAMQGQVEQAISAFELALKQNPNFADARNNLGNAYRLRGMYKPALEQFQEAIRLKPDFAEAHHNLGLVYLLLGKPSEAMGAIQHALRLRPNYADAINSFKEVLNRYPNSPEAHLDLGNALATMGRFDEATEYYQKALAQRPDFAEAFNNLSNIAHTKGRLDEALELVQKALKARPDYPEAHNNLGALYKEQGHFDKAQAEFHEALRIKPSYPLALYNLSELAASGKYSFTEDEFEQINKLLDSGKLSHEESLQLHFALWGVYDKQGDYEKAFAQFHKGNERARAWYKHRGSVYTPAKDRAFFNRIIAFFSPAYFQRTSGFGVASDTPVFIVGMPRSGTTLVQQILSSHPDVFGAGELGEMRRIAGSLPELCNPLPSRQGKGPGFPECLANLSVEAAARVSQGHIDYLTKIGGGKARVIDKMPFNFMYLGLIATLFPHAKIIHCLRDPIDTGLSCYFQNFNSLPFTTSLEGIGIFHKEYERMMAHWRQVLPTHVLDVQYEALIADQEAVTRRMVAHLGLEWSDQCLEFTKNKRAVRTASLMQVRQPIYNTSVGRWRNYAKHVQPLIDALKAENN